MPADPRRAVGLSGERLAADHLERAGYRVLERNFRTRAGELDLVAIGHGCLVFCEVRARVGRRAPPPLARGGPLESIGLAKRRQVRRLAREWLAVRGAELRAGHSAADRARLRFDAIGVVLERDGTPLALEHVEDAF